MNKKFSLSILGPNYSYCHISAMKAFPEAEFVFCPTINEVFKSVIEGKTEYGLSPIENMLHGSVREAMFALKQYSVKINKLINLPIHHCLASQSPNFKKIISHPQALAQCSKFLESYREKGYPILESSSTSKAMDLASQDKEIAGIGSQQAAEFFNLSILNENIEDNHDNMTSFILISKKENEEINESSRTSIIIQPKEDKSGILHDILSVFKTNNINLTKIESIPTGKRIGEYLFYIEIDGNIKDDNLSSSLISLKKVHHLYLFGSYPIENLN
ncbi:MAG: prephenate dehydratase [Nanoarchaeota archaeon]|nr:prephenate dehydratase [Nanoarchaeota archaeon]